MITRKQIEERERRMLAPYAALAAESRGRKYPQEDHPLRTAFQRDRDRIVHSNAFRRMEFKTQVFLPHEGDHYRTRLTHTIEVAQISRTLARNLQLNEDLTEAIALVHDLGHTPFGHSGEDVLDELLSDYGGFNHNAQSLRVVDLLEKVYPHHDGLNLSYEVREGIVKHETKRKTAHPDFDQDLHPTLEASLVDMADEITYNAHDIDDGLRAGLISGEQLLRLSIFGNLPEELAQTVSRSIESMQEMGRYRLVRWLLNQTATDLLEETDRRLTRLQIGSVEQMRRVAEPVCGYSSAMAPLVAELKQFLRRELYGHSRLTELSREANEIIEYLFEKFMRDPTSLPNRFSARLGNEPLVTVVTDYIAGMTDRYAERLFSETH